MSMPPILYDTHMHTPLCRHATGEPTEYARQAKRQRLKGIIFTCHNPFPDGYSQAARMYLDDWDEYLDMVDRARVRWRGKVDVRLGLECDYHPDYLDFLAQQIDSAPFDYILGSVHPQVREYRQKFFTSDEFAYQQLYFDHLARAAETGLFDCLSHPDLVKNMAPKEWDLDRIMPYVREALDRIAATGVAMELNTSGETKAIKEMNPGRAILEEMCQRGIPVVVGSDAHEPRRVGDRFERAIDTLRRVGYQEINVFLGRQRHSIPIESAMVSVVA